MSTRPRLDRVRSFERYPCEFGVIDARENDHSTDRILVIAKAAIDEQGHHEGGASSLAGGGLAEKMLVRQRPV